MKVLKSVLIGVLSGASIFAVTFYVTTTYKDFENKTYDLRFIYKLNKFSFGRDIEKSRKIHYIPRKVKTIDDIIIVDIDEKSLTKLGRFQTWPRIYHAKVIDYINSGGATLIGFDIFLSESDRISEIAVQLFKDANREIDEAVADSVLARFSFDEEFANTAKKWGNVCFAFHFPKESRREISDETLKDFAYDFDIIHKIKEAEDVLPPVDVILKSARSIGFANAPPDPDGVMRSMPLFLVYKGKFYPSFGFQIACEKLGIKKDEVSVSSNGFVFLKDRKIPVDESLRTLINYRGPSKSFRTISYSDVFFKRLPEKFFKDRIVLIGASASGLGDLKTTPFSPGFPGVEVHANLIYNILDNEFILRPDLFTTLISICILSMITAVLCYTLRIAKSVFSVICIVSMFIGAAYFIFFYYSRWIEIVRPVYGIILSYVAVNIYRYLSVEKEKKKIRGLFSRFVPNEVVNRLVREPTKLALGGERKELTVFFSDIRNFTAMSEKMRPEKVVSILNEYLSEMSKIIFRNGGTIDKYMGDGIMALFGTPIYHSDHAFRAVKTAVEMRKSMIALKDKWTKEGKEVFDVGIGVNSGDMVSGFIGSKERLEYTVIGDNVNLAARLEPLNKVYDTDIIISENTYNRIKDKVIVMEIEFVKVKGKEKTMKIYEVIDLR